MYLPRWAAGQLRRSAPSRRTVPELGFSAPTMRRRSVDLPAPERPITPTLSPGWMRALTRLMIIFPLGSPGTGTA